MSARSGLLFDSIESTKSKLFDIITGLDRSVGLEIVLYIKSIDSRLSSGY